MDKLMTNPELAAYLQVPLSTVYEWRYRRTGPPGVRIGKHVRYREADVERWLADRQTAEGNSIVSA
jgi:excisionase family DNA binding protein